MGSSTHRSPRQLMELKQMNKLAIAAAIAATATSAAYAQESTTTGVGSPAGAQVLTAIPQDAMTVTNFYKQNVYDPSNVKIGEINDVLVDKDGSPFHFSPLTILHLLPPAACGSSSTGHPCATEKSNPA